MDQTQDLNGAEMHRLVQLYRAPDFVKTASAGQLTPAKPLAAPLYAWPQRELFPLHTKAATWTSYAFFLEKKAELSKLDAECIEERILHAAKIHGVTKHCELLKQAHADNRPRTEEELPDDDFAVVVKKADGTTERHMPMRNALETKRAAAYLEEHRDLIPFEQRRDIAERILFKVTQYGAALGNSAEYVEKQAGYGAGTASDAVACIRARVHASRRGPGAMSEKQAELLKLADILEEKPAQLRAPGIRVKLATVLDEFDREMKLTDQVREGHLARIEDVLFGLTRQKMAAAIDEHTQTITGNVYRLTDIERVKLGHFRDIFGDDIADELTADGLHVSGEKAAAVVPTLPRGDAQLFDRLMAEQSVYPVIKQASAEQVKIEHQFLQEIAQNYRR